jgi:hypothetical protein
MGGSTKGNGVPAASLRPFFRRLSGIAVGCWCDATTPLEAAMRIFSVASRLEEPSSSRTFDLLDVDLIKSRFDEQVADCDRPWGNPFDESFSDDLCLSLDGLPVDPTKIRVKPGKVKIPELPGSKPAHANRLRKAN